MGKQPHKKLLKATTPNLDDIDGKNFKPGLCEVQWVPPEYLVIISNQLFKKPLLALQTKDMISVARRLPADNVMLIVDEGLPRVITTPRSASDLLLAKKKLIKVLAQIMRTPTLQMQKETPKETQKETQDKLVELQSWFVHLGSWNLSEAIFIRRGKVPNKSDEKKVKTALVRVSNTVGTTDFKSKLRA